MQIYRQFTKLYSVEEFGGEFSGPEKFRRNGSQNGGGQVFHGACQKVWAYEKAGGDVVA
jgi:hypothetical protein